ncbi:MAG: hypothetical protein Q9216_007197, partial [Gyalolechia sp. 2 TL-2023]
QRFFGPADSAQIDTRRQAFSVHFDDDGDAYRFEISAPDEWCFDSVWDTLGVWLKHGADREWSEENLEFAIAANNRANSMKILRLIKDTEPEILPVADRVDENYFDADCEERENGRSRILDVGGGLTKLKAELECGAGDQGSYS